MDSFEYNAPKFINFLERQSIEENDGADTFFDCHVGDTPRPTKQRSYISDADKAEPNVGDSLQTTVVASDRLQTAAVTLDSLQTTAVTPTLHTPEKDSSCVSNETYTISPASNVATRLKELDSIEEENDINKLIRKNFWWHPHSVVQLPQKPIANKSYRYSTHVFSNVQVLSVKTPVKQDNESTKKERVPKVHSMSLRSDAKKSSASKNVLAKVSLTSCDKMKNKKIVSSEGTLESRRKLGFPSTSQDEKKCAVIETSKRKGSPLVCATNKRFVSLAEAVIRFQQNTPERFHSQPRAKASLIRRLTQKQHFSPPHGTIPQSPHLLTKERTRPVNCLSREAKEEKEIEEIKAFHLKARPLDKKALEAWVPPPMEKKANTVPQPFNLTEMKKKENKPPEVFSFTAKPAPKKIFEAPQGIPQKKVQPTTNPVTPNVARKVKHMTAAAIVQDEHDGLQVVNKEVPHDSVPTINNQMHTTEVRPFTFEERDREMQRRKEERLQKILEEEKKAREFKANPLPSFIKSPRNSSMLSITRKKPDPKEEEQHTVFKARPPTVLYKKPFVPEKIAHPLTDTTQIVLNTERRIKERENFEKELKEREALIEEHKRREAERLLQEEEEARALLRKMAVHKANPIRKYKTVDVHPSEKLLTAPNSPAFHIKGKEK